MTTYYVNGVKTPKDKLGELEIKSEIVKNVILRSLMEARENEGCNDSRMLGNG